MKIGIANDHTGVDYKEMLSEYITEKYGYEVVNYGTDSRRSSDYAVVAEILANAVVKEEVDLGIAICGTGLGIGIAANKVRGIRCAICSEPYSAAMAREHNSANMIAFGARVVASEMAKLIVDTFITSEFQGGRHARRIVQIGDIERRQYEKA